MVVRPALGLLLNGFIVGACTNFLVSKGASADGSTQIAYNADSGSLYGSLGHYPAADHASGAMREVWDWDASTYLGSIPEANHTYNVVGNVNEHGLIIGETTFGGLPELDARGKGGIMDYGSLIWISLQRCKTAREAIHLIDELCQEHGYASEGESFSLADGKEVWLMELIGKGNFSKGAVWVASKVPEGWVGSTANQARTRTFAQSDPENVLYAKDVVTFAQDIGLYPKTASAAAFSFSDVYDPVSFTGARVAEARVWHLYMAATNGGFEEYLDYAQGYNLTNRMPLFAKPAFKISVNDTMRFMRTHFEGTWFDPTGTARPDVGAGSGNSPYRWRPLVWASEGEYYLNERTIGVQQTAWNFVAQSRSWMPAPLRALMWWAPDDSSTAVRVPVYGGATSIPKTFADPVGQEPAAAVAGGPAADAGTMSLDSAFWVWNLVANLAYGERYNVVYPVVLSELLMHQDALFAATAKVDKAVAQLFAEGQEAKAVEKLTSFVVSTGDDMTSQWRGFWMRLFAMFRDGFTAGPPVAKQCDVSKGEREHCTSRLVPDMQASGYSKAWYARIVADGDNKKHYGLPAEVEKIDRRKLGVVDKAHPRM